MPRNLPKGAAGYAMNALLAGAGNNLRKFLRHVALCWLHFLQRWERFVAAAPFRAAVD